MSFLLRGYFPHYSSRNHFKNNIFKYKREVISSNKLQPNDIRRLSRSNQRQYNEKYFRPSKFPSINTKNMDDIIFKFYEKDQSKNSLPSDLMDSAENTIINFFSILREANQGASEEVGCGTIGMEMLPYPIAYEFLSKDLQSHITYEEFLKLYKNIFHINLIKMVELPNKKYKNDIVTFLVEFETIQGTCFCYYYGYYTVQKENDNYKIKSFEFNKEDFLCAPYHYWQHNAEMKVEAMYGNWCKLIQKQYHTKKEGFLKKILIDGTDKNMYLFTFVELTNGTDIEIAQHKKENGKWVLVNINPYDCMKSSGHNTIDFIILPENITTGFTWRYNVENEGIIQVIDNGYEEFEHEEGMLGVGGIHTWTIKPLKEGTTKIIFELSRAWTSNEVLEKKVYTVTAYKTIKNGPLFIKIKEKYT